MSDENVMVGSADHELFNDALVSPEPAQETAKVSVDQPLLEQAETLRDDQGRFAPKPGDEPKAAVEAEQPPAAEHKEPPEFRFREVSEAKRQAEERAKALEEQNRQLMAMLSQHKPQPQQPKQEAVDPIEALLSDPDKWAQQQLDPVTEQIRQTREFYSRKDAVREHGAEKVSEAYKALDAAVSSGEMNRDAVLSGLRQSMDPYGDILTWHNERVARQKVGNDPDAYFSRTLDERLSDPAFAAQLVEKLTGQARQQPQNGNGRPAIDIPPSLSRVTTAAPATGSLGDMSDKSIFENALR